MNKMLIQIAISFILLLIGCDASLPISKENVRGEWKGIYLKDTVSASFLATTLELDYSWQDSSKIVTWSYELNKDTLILYNDEYKEKHIFSKLTSNTLKLKPDKINQVDISLIDAVTFKKE